MGKRPVHGSLGRSVEHDRRAGIRLHQVVVALLGQRSERRRLDDAVVAVSHVGFVVIRLEMIGADNACPVVVGVDLADHRHAVCACLFEQFDGVNRALQRLLVHVVEEDAVAVDGRVGDDLLKPHRPGRGGIWLE